ncbi:hypothetical protein IKF74_01605 [Candidatus Saccharibacteria bacterium]|nr:hypothetical protein [Candidatus Saccharibacteria bacterium]
MEEDKVKIAQTDSALQSPAEQGSKPLKPEKSGKGLKAGMAICAILALGGIGFGIYEMSQVKTAKQQIADLKIEVKKDDGSTTTIETDKIEVKEADKTVVITDSANAENTKEYIYIGEWGIKIKIPENLTFYRYTYTPYSGTKVIGTDGSEIQTSTLCISAATKGHEPETPSFVNSCMYALNKNIGQADEGSGAFWQYTVPSGEFYYVGPQAMLGDEAQKDWEVESVNAIKNWLSDEANRSAI